MPLNIWEEEFLREKGKEYLGLKDAVEVGLECMGAEPV
jgi:hypothetical protein